MISWIATMICGSSGVATLMSWIATLSRWSQPWSINYYHDPWIAILIRGSQPWSICCNPDPWDAILISDVATLIRGSQPWSEGRNSDPWVATLVRGYQPYSVGRNPDPWVVTLITLSQRGSAIFKLKNCVRNSLKPVSTIIKHHQVQNTSIWMILWLLLKCCCPRWVIIIESNSKPFALKYR